MNDGTASGLSVDALAREAGVEVEYVQGLVDVGALHPGEDGLHTTQDVRQIGLIQALEAGGIELQDVAWVIRDAGMPLDRVGEMWTLAESSGRTFSEFCAVVGEHAALLPEIYASFGLAVPAPETMMRRDEEAVLTSFLEVWGLVEDRPEVYARAARIVGEGVRRIEAATVDLFGELGGPPPARLRKGYSLEEAQQPSRLMSPTLEKTLVWLHRRHIEHEVFERIVSAVEGTLARAGRREQAQAEPPAVAFVDLSGYTALAAGEGDERAASAATSLHALALEAARAHGGRVVKLLGDGVILRYASAGDALGSVAELMHAVRAAGLPPAHAGIAAGPVVTRDGDIYGHTVNLASRIASRAAPGELLVPSDVVHEARRSGFACEEVGDAALKGVADPVSLSRVLLD